LFFGREDLVSIVVNRIRTNLESDQRFLAIIGASGSGKSSLVRAGVIPALGWNREFAGWGNFVLTPTSHPLKALGEVISSLAVSPYTPNLLTHLFAKDPGGLNQSLYEAFHYVWGNKLRYDLITHDTRLLQDRIDYYW